MKKHYCKEHDKHYTANKYGVARCPECHKELVKLIEKVQELESKPLPCGCTLRGSTIYLPAASIYIENKKERV